MSITCGPERSAYYIYKNKKERAAAIKDFISKSQLDDLDSFTIDIKDFLSSGVGQYKDLKILIIELKEKQNYSIPFDYSPHISTCYVTTPIISTGTARKQDEWPKKIYIGDRPDLAPYVTCGPNGDLSQVVYKA